MSQVLLPDNIVSYIQALEARIKKLEVGVPLNGYSRLGINELVGPDTGPALVVDGAYGNLSTAGPAVTCITGKKAIVIGSAIIALGQAATYRNLGAKISYSVTGATTIDVNTIGIPTEGSLNFNTSGGVVTYSLIATISFVDILDTLNPGENTFTMKYAYMSAAGGAASTTFRNVSIVVLPVDV